MVMSEFVKAVLFLSVIGGAALPAIPAPVKSSVRVAYPAAQQRKLQAFFERDRALRLESAAQAYMKVQKSGASIIDAARKAGLSAETVRELGQRFPAPASLPEVRFHGDTAILREGKNEIRIGTSEVANRSLLVNGQRFRWEESRSAADNLRRYETLFTTEAAATWSPVRSAWAEEERGQSFRIRMAGLVLYFNVPRATKKLFTDLQLDVTDTLAKCRASLPAGAEDQITTALFAKTNPPASAMETRLASCADLTKAAAGLRLDLPAGLCESLDQLASCLAQAMGPAEAISDAERKHVPEWAPSSSQPGAPPQQDAETTD